MDYIDTDKARIAWAAEDLAFAQHHAAALLDPRVTGQRRALLMAKRDLAVAGAMGVLAPIPASEIVRHFKVSR